MSGLMTQWRSNSTETLKRNTLFTFKRCELAAYSKWDKFSKFEIYESYVLTSETGSLYKRSEDTKKKRKICFKNNTISSTVKKMTEPQAFTVGASTKMVSLLL
jgi:hypothetical protein